MNPKHYVDDPKHTIALVGPITLTTVAELMPIISHLDKRKLANGFRIRMASPGGEASACLALFDIIKLCNNEVTIEAFGECSSAAAILLQAADNRWLAPRCRMLIHNGAVDAAVEAVSGRKLVEAGQEVVRLDEIFCDIFVSRSGLPKETVEKWLEAETYFTAQEAVQQGLADWVITK